LFGFGIDGILTLLPIAWSDYFGRANFAAIRSLALRTGIGPGGWPAAGRRIA
jgi:hypothetical protein